MLTFSEFQLLVVRGPMHSFLALGSPLAPRCWRRPTPRSFQWLTVSGLSPLPPAICSPEPEADLHPGSCDEPEAWLHLTFQLGQANMN